MLPEVPLKVLKNGKCNYSILFENELIGSQAMQDTRSPPDRKEFYVGGHQGL